jgi:hypothetical protein
MPNVGRTRRAQRGRPFWPRNCRPRRSASSTLSGRRHQWAASASARNCARSRSRYRGPGLGKMTAPTPHAWAKPWAGARRMAGFAGATPRGRQGLAHCSRSRGRRALSRKAVFRFTTRSPPIRGQRASVRAIVGAPPYGPRGVASGARSRLAHNLWSPDQPGDPATARPLGPTRCAQRTGA